MNKRTKKDGAWLKEYVKRMDRTILELRRLNEKEERLKSLMFAWLRDHHVRLGRHWDKIVRMG